MSLFKSHFRLILVGQFERKELNLSFKAFQIGCSTKAQENNNNQTRTTVEKPKATQTRSQKGSI